LITGPIFAQETPIPEFKLFNIVRNYSDKQPFNGPTGIFFDRFKQEIYLADSGNGLVSIFDLKGTTILTFKHWVTDPLSGERVLGNPRSVVCMANGDIVVSDGRTDNLDVYDFRGEHIISLDPDDFDPPVKSFKAAELAVGKDRNLYVAVTFENCEILKLNPDYELQFRFGKSGKDSSQFESISGLWIGDDGKIYVCDIFSVPVVKIFGPDGKYFEGFGGHSVERLDFSFPSDIVVMKNGMIFVSDSIRQVVKCLDKNGRFVTMIGGFGINPGDMRYPSALASDGDTLLIVAEKNGNRYQQFIVR